MSWDGDGPTMLVAGLGVGAEQAVSEPSRQPGKAVTQSGLSSVLFYWPRLTGLKQLQASS